MLKLILVLVSFVLSLQATEPLVISTIDPYQFFIKKIAGDTVEVAVFVPSGVSSHSFEPTSGQVMKLSRADIWFTIGEAFETKVVQVINSYNKNMQISNLQEGIDLIHPKQCKNLCCQGNADLHFWLDTQNVKKQAGKIESVLSAKFPEHKNLYAENLTKLLSEIDSLTQKINIITADAKNRSFMISHPALAYFGRQFNFNQIPIEFEGKEPSPKQITALLKLAKENNISQIFVEPQYLNKAAQVLSQKIGANLITIDPYSANYPQMMLNIAHKLSS